MTDKIKILVGMGTCGLAAGAQSVYDTLLESVKELNIYAEIIPT